MDSVLALWPYLLYLLPVAAGGAVWAMRRSFASTERVERLENRMTEMESGCCPSGCSHFPINWSCCLKTQ